VPAKACGADSIRSPATLPVHSLTLVVVVVYNKS
jgi:hypothetical protein